MWDLVKFVTCTLVSRLQMTFYILTKGIQSLETRVHMTNLTRSILIMRIIPTSYSEKILKNYRF